jgi:glycosyltransferase involved in cell wall biosynthesis
LADEGFDKRLSEVRCVANETKVLVGIPAFNEERTIAKIIVKCQKFAERIVVVDDGSIDDTAAIAERLGATVLKHDKNLGKGAGLRDCFDWAKGSGFDVLITLDADGQHDPTQIPGLIAALEDTQADVVIGGRMKRPPDMPRYRWLGGRTLDVATGVKSDERFVDSQSGFRAYSRRAIETLSTAEYGMGGDAEIIMRARDAGLKIVETPISASYDQVKPSARNPLLHWLEVTSSIVKFVSIRHPLLFYGLFAACSLTVSIVFGFMTVDYYQRWGRVITNLALISVATGIVGFLALFTGVILFTLITVVREKR